MIDKRKSLNPEVNLPAIKKWADRLAVHPDVLGWIIEIYAKSSADAEVITVMRRVSAAQSTRNKNLPNMRQRKRIEWNDEKTG